MQRSWWTIALTTAILALLGCATERPTNVPADTAFPTLDLSDPIVLHDYGVFDSVAYNDTLNREAALQLPIDLLSALSGTLDIHVYYRGPEPCRRAVVSVYNYENSTWVEIENQLTAFPCYGMFDDDNRVSLLTLLTSEHGSVISSAGLLTLRGDFHEPSARILQVDERYRPIPLSLRVWGESVFWTGSGLVVWTHQRGDDHDWITDSLIHLDRFGNRTYAGDVGIGSGNGSGWSGVTWSEIGLWLTSGGGHYQLLDESGNTIGEFAHIVSDPIQRPDGSAPIVWVNDEIWIRERRFDIPFDPREPPSYSPYIAVVDPWASLETDTSVLIRRFPLDGWLRGMGDMTFDGEHVCGLTLEGLVRLDLNGQIVDTLPLPIWPTSVTWDGEAFWMTHGGPWDYITEHRMISRFYPR